jgi:hypothetical protein
LIRTYEAAILSFQFWFHDIYTMRFTHTRQHVADPTPLTPRRRAVSEGAVTLLGLLQDTLEHAWSTGVDNVHSA